MKRLSAILLACLLCIVLLNGCGAKPRDPVSLTLWHVYGSQTDSPMNDMVDEFNRTEGVKTGITINVTSVSNSSDIHTALTAAARGDAGAGKLPDLFFCYPETAGDIGADKLIDWSVSMERKELDEYLPAFISEGKVDGALLVLPVAKSSEALFVNATIFDRFSAETGASYDDLGTWEGLMNTAAEYYTWSDGKSFFMHDELLNFIQINTAALGGSAYRNGTINFDDPVLQSQWLELARSAISGQILLKDAYATTCMMTGDIVAGVESTASILYFQDTVTYPDNTTEPLVLRAFPCPVTKNGKRLAMQQGVGLCAVKGSERKNEAALTFARWLTEGQNNLKFVAASGYLPVKKGSFSAIAEYEYPNEAYRELYAAMYEMYQTYDFYLPPMVDGYYDILWSFYQSASSTLADCRTRYLRGGETVDALAQESLKTIRGIMESSHN